MKSFCLIPLSVKEYRHRNLIVVYSELEVIVVPSEVISYNPDASMSIILTCTDILEQFKLILSYLSHKCYALSNELVLTKIENVFLFLQILDAKSSLILNENKLLLNLDEKYVLDSHQIIFMFTKHDQIIFVNITRRS